jgi:iron complex outermembrane receptor protein
MRRKPKREYRLGNQGSEMSSTLARRAPHFRNTLAQTISLILAAASANAQQASTPSAPSDNAGGTTLAEVTVTAQRRTQTVQDIPYNISVVPGDDLGSAAIDDASDLTKIVPGLLAVDTGPAARGNVNSFVLRGLTTQNPGAVDFPGQTESPVSTYFGETPIFIPLILRDLDHVEVLLGPQGTLYGSGSEAGTIRFIPNRPKFDEFSADVSVGEGKTENSGSFNNRADLVLNIPIASQLALRVVAGEEHLAGFIDDVGLAVRQGTGFLAPPIPRVPGDPTSGFAIAPPLRDANPSEQTYIRGALRWDPAQGVDLEMTYLHQTTTVDDCQCSNPNWPGGTMNLASGYTGPIPPFANASYTVPAGGPYNSTNLTREPYDNSVDLGSVVGSVDIGLATITSATSMYNSETGGTRDNSFEWYIPGGTNFLPYYANYPRDIAVEHDYVQDKAFIQELRLVSNGKHMFDYVVGAFFERETGQDIDQQWMPGLQQFYTDVGFTSPNPEFGDLVIYENQQTRFLDRAVFGELTWNITPEWQVTGGVRFFSQSFGVDWAEELPNCGSPCGNQYGGFEVSNTQEAHKHLFKLNTSYDLSTDMKLYATYSEGFRRGGATGLPPEGIYASEPKYFTYTPDFSKNYEVGLKGSAFNSRLQYTADVFLINLDNFQFDSYSPSGLPAVYNGSEARSKGAEIQLNAALTRSITASLGYNYTDAVVTEATSIYDLPAFGGPGSTPVLAVAIPEGTRLPGVPKSIVNAALDYRMPVGSAGWSLDYHIDEMYRTSAPGAIPGVFLSGYTIESWRILNAVISLDSGKRWSFELYGDNLTSDPEYSGAIGVQGLPLNSLNDRDVARPRTIGLMAHFHLE